MGINTELGKRIGEMAVALCGSKSGFAKSLGVTPQNLNHWISRGVGSRTLDYILIKHPEVNRDWLFNGEGNMLTDCGILAKEITILDNLPRARRIGERIKYASEQLAPTKTAFAEKIGESPKVLSSWIARGANKQNLERILAAYPIINRDWLINGNGLPFLDDVKTPNTNQIDDTKDSNPYQSDDDNSVLFGECNTEIGAMAGANMGTVGAGIGAALGTIGTIGNLLSSRKRKEDVPREEKTISSGGNEIMNNTVQILSSVIDKLSSQLSDKDKVIIKQMDEIASRDERIRELEKLIHQNNITV